MAVLAPRMGLLSVLWKVVALVVLAVVGLGAYLYFTDYEAKASVTEKGRDGGGDYVVVTPSLFPYDHKKYLSSDEAQFVCKGYEVTFRLQTQHFRVFDDRGTLVYDSQEGLRDRAALLRCGASNTAGGILTRAG